MEFLVDTVSVMMLCGLVVSPVLVIRFLNRSNINYKFIAYLSIGGILTACIVIVFAWWSDASLQLLMTYYGYNFDAWNESDAYTTVAPENVNRVKGLWNQMMGVGWPLKAMICYVTYSPYLLFVAILNYIIRRRKNTVGQSADSA